MPKSSQLKFLLSDVDSWNKKRPESVNLQNAKLQGLHLEGINLSNTNLRGADFSKCNLKGADLSNSDLQDADLRYADFTKANLINTNLSNSTVRGAKFIEADLSNGNLSEVNARKANFKNANLNNIWATYGQFTGCQFSHASLLNVNGTDATYRGAKFHQANLSQAQLSRSDFTNADFKKAKLSEVMFYDSRLSNTNLTSADLTNADLRLASLVGANLTDCILKGCAVYGTSVWEIVGIPKDQKDLLLTNNFPNGYIRSYYEKRYYGLEEQKQFDAFDQDDKNNNEVESVRQPENEIYKFESSSVISVDDIEVAQFIYLLLNRDKLRNVINTITSKAVLILGRFSDERKKILYGIAQKVRDHNLLPVIFDFEKANSRDFTETIKTLAGISFFVIADITKPQSTPLELQAIIPDYQIPFVPILQKGELEFSMFKNLQTKYDWVLETLTYASLDSLLNTFDKAILEEAIQVHNRIMQRKAEQVRTRSTEDYLN